jgi:hypothetical protein
MKCVSIIYLRLASPSDNTASLSLVIQMQCAKWHEGLKGLLNEGVGGCLRNNTDTK